MKYVYIVGDIVHEIIPENDPIFPGIPIAKRYSPEFLSHCVAVTNNTVVEQNWIYDPESKTFSAPPVEEVSEDGEQEH